MNTDSRLSPKLENWLYPLLVGAMSGCIALSLVELLRALFVAWNATCLIVACVLAALEANYSYRLIRRVLYADRPKFRIVELTMLFVLLKIGGYMGHSWADVLADIRTWPRQPLNIINLETMIVYGVAFLSWLASTLTTRDLERIGESAESDSHYISPTESLSRRFFLGGIALFTIVGCTHLVRVGMAEFFNLSRPSVQGLVLNVLAYFLLGLVMMGQVHFVRLHRAWESQKVKTAEGLPTRWVRYSLIFISLVALLAFLLPTGYTVGLLDVAATVIAVLLSAVELLAVLVILPFAWLGWLLSKLRGEEGPSPPEVDFPMLELAPQENTGGAGPGWFEVLRSLLFWAIALGIVFYVVRSYLRDHPEIVGALVTLRPIHALRRWLAALWQRLIGMAESISDRLPRGVLLRRTRRKESETGWRFFRLGALSYRERILYYFLSTVRRAGRHGFPRRSTQTPYEYEAALDPHLPEAQPEMEALTQAFVEARYSRQAFDRERDRQVRADWEKVKAALRALKRKKDTES